MESTDSKQAKVTENIRIYVRVRTGTTDTGSCLHVSPQSGEITAVRQPKPGEPAEALQHSFKFDAVGDAETDQASVFAAVGIQAALVERARTPSSSPRLSSMAAKRM